MPDDAASGDVDRSDEVHDSPRMSDFEAVMWELERDPHLSSAFANVTLFDRPPDRDRFRARMAGAVQAVPRLRQRVVPSPGRLAPPEWREDPGFDLGHHLRWVDLGGDADRRDLFDLVATLSSQPFDRSRPLWEFVVVEGLAGGRAAMVQRLHHTITDGTGGIRISVQFVDLEADPPAPPAQPSPPPSAGGPRSDAAGPDDAGPDDAGDDPTAPWWSRTAQAAGHRARSEAGRLGGAVAGIGGTVRHPSRLPGIGSDLVGVARSALHQVRVDGHRSPLWTERSLRRWFGATELHLDDVRDAARALGGSVNDLFVTGAAAAAARAHERAGHPVEQLRVSIPVSTRHDRRAGGNAFAPAQALVHTGSATPQERFDAVHATLGDVKAERALGAVDQAAAALSLLPSGVLVRTGRRVAGAVDFVCSNVRAAPFDLYIGGALLEANYPIGPLAGTAFNLTTMSYRGWLFLGLVVDTAAVEDPEGLLGDLRASYRELLAAGGVRRPRTLS